MAFLPTPLLHLNLGLFASPLGRACPHPLPPGSGLCLLVLPPPRLPTPPPPPPPLLLPPAVPLPHTGRASVWPCRRNTLPSSPGCPTTSLGPLEPPVFPRVTNLFSLFCHCCRGLSPPQESAPSLRRGQRMAAAPPPAAPTAPHSPGPAQSRRHPASLMNETRNETISMKHSYCLARARSSGCGWLSQSLTPSSGY